MMDSLLIIAGDFSSKKRRRDDRDEDDEDDILIARMLDLCLFSSSQAFTSFTTKMKL